MTRGYGKKVLSMLRCADSLMENRTYSSYPQVLGRDFTGEVVCVVFPFFLPKILLFPTP